MIEIVTEASLSPSLQNFSDSKFVYSEGFSYFSYFPDHCAVVAEASMPENDSPFLYEGSGMLVDGRRSLNACLAPNHLILL